MIEKKAQQPAAAVRDPICGMAIEPAQAFATRTMGEARFYFCSQRCVQQFDREHIVSSTTGVPEQGTPFTAALHRIELSVPDVHDRHTASRLRDHLAALPGVRHVHVNAKTASAHIVFAPTQTSVETLVGHIRMAGYTVGTAATRLDLQGIHCASCIVTVEQALQKTPGVLNATVNPVTQQAHIEYLPGLIDRSGLQQAVDAAGYRVQEETRPAETSLERAG